MINTQSFVLYESVYKHIQTLSNRVSETTALHYINCIMEFGLYGVEPPDDDEVWIYGFEQAMTSIYSAKERYNKSKENGRKGGAPERFTKEQVKELKDQGLTNKEVANTLFISSSAFLKGDYILSTRIYGISNVTMSLAETSVCLSIHSITIFNSK